jgi:alkylation response protein AidB-like acyl-CoA dehydrogenase
MDFGETSEEASFRRELQAWLTGALPRLPPAASTDLGDRLDQFRLWQGELHGAGYAGLTWPPEYGGRGSTIMERAIYLEEADRAGAPESLNGIGEGFAGPTIIEFGTEEQKRALLPPILRGDEIWCQLFSEPGAGSDLASLQTRAERIDGGWAITGQKVWTSRAQSADWAILLARTGDEPRHRGISYFLLPMRQEGVTVRPLRQITGEDEFNEVFLDGAVVPDDRLVGEVDGGWRIALATLQYERATLATGRINVRRWLDELLELARERASAGRVGTSVRERLARVYGKTLIHQLTARRALTRMADGQPPGPESSAGKLFLYDLLGEITALALEMQGLEGQMLGSRSDSDDLWERRALWIRGMSLAGGTPQIQKNILAERVLGLPRG